MHPCTLGRNVPCASRDSLNNPAADAPAEHSAADPQRAQDVAARSESGNRRLSGRWAVLVALLAGGWSLFQLMLPAPFMPVISDGYARLLHCAFAMALVFLCFSQWSAKSVLGRVQQARAPWLAWMSREHSVPWMDAVLALAAVACVGYFIVDYQGIADRQGRPLTRDMVAGMGLLLLLLLAAWRCLGPALSLLAMIFLGMALFGATVFVDWLDVGWWNQPNRSLRRVLDQMVMSTEGIFGTPLMVSTNVVFVYVLFGALLARAGGGSWFTNLAMSLVGGFRGGPAKASVLASGLTGSVSGSSIANTVTTGTFTIPLMRRAGYPAEKAGAIEVAASTNGQLMPPIMGAAAFIIATFCEMDYLEVVKHAALPALVSYLTLVWITHMEACKLGLQPIPRSELPRFWPTFWRGAHFLIPIAFLIVQLAWYRRSPERAAFDAILALMAVILLRECYQGWRGQRSLRHSLRDGLAAVGAGLVAGGRNMMGIGVAVAAAGIIVGVVNMGLGGMISEFVAVVSGDSFMVLLLLTALAGLILGIGLPTTANYIVMASLTAPIIMRLAPPELALPIIAVHLFVFYFGILADDTPPVGLAAYAAAAISGGKPIATGVQGFIYDMRTALLPFMFIFNHSLLLIGVSSWWHGLGIFFSALVAMFCFASLLQHWVLLRNRLWESLALVVAVFALLRPGLVASWLNQDPSLSYVLGFLLAAAVLLAQWSRFTAGSTTARAVIAKQPERAT
ncbi:MAG: TRAP transporter permease [Planctomycetota bacterium]|nr:MAG: TRAP transporter permease [Planctomycetota bacterium]